MELLETLHVELVVWDYETKGSALDLSSQTYRITSNNFTLENLKVFGSTPIKVLDILL